MNLKFSKKPLLASVRRGVIAVLALALAGSAKASVYTWSGAGTNHGWLQKINYAGGGSGTYAFTAADTIYFSSASAGYYTPVFGGAGTIGTLEFGAETGTNAITIAWQNSAEIRLASGITVDAGAGANTINAPLVLDGPATTFTNNSTNILTVSALSGDSSLTLNGGTFHFQALNGGVFNYTGTTTVNAGATLRVLNTAVLTGGVTVKSGGTLGGRGTIGATTIENGGALSPGVPTASANSISFSDSLTLSAGSLTLLDLAGTGFDSVNVSGSLTYGGGLRLTLSDDFAAPGDYALFDFASGAASGDFDSFELYDSGGWIGELALDQDVWSGEVSGLLFSFDQASGLLTVATVPEPDTAAQAFVALLGLLVLKTGIARSSARAAGTR